MNSFSGLIVLLTDFGNSEYVGIMKGVILSHNPSCRLIDLVHQIHSCSVVEGAWILRSSFSYFPKGTTFLCVVDPGVGSSRRAIAVLTKSGNTFIGPDNGLLIPAIIADGGFSEAFSLRIPSKSSSTFHGRDVFAPAAAKISSTGILNAFQQQLLLGSKIALDQNPLCNNIDFIEKMESIPDGSVKSSGIIVHIDHFGNLITSCPSPADYNIPNGTEIIYSISPNQGFSSGSNAILKPILYYKLYSDFPFENTLYLIIGSSNTFELSIKNGSATSLCSSFHIGDLVSILIPK